MEVTAASAAAGAAPAGMGRGYQIAMAVVIAITAVVAAGVIGCLRIWLSLAPDEGFAFIRSNSFIPQPSSHHARHRGAEYLREQDRFFFQWWNYLIVDTEAHEQYQLLFQVAHHSSRAAVVLRDYLLVGAKHRHADGSSSDASEFIPLDAVTLSADMDIAAGSFSQTAVDDDSFIVTAAFSSSGSSSGPGLSFSLSFHRVHGLYSGLDREKDNVRDCLLISNHFAYNSRVSGWWSSSPQHNVSFSASPTSQLRAYAASSWGCQLPHTDTEPPISFPWTWLWLALPASASHPEFSLCIGTARLEAGPLGALQAGVSVMGWGDELVGAVFASAFHKTSVQLPLLSAASDGYLAAFNFSLSDWASSSPSSSGSDALGPYSLPLAQAYSISTASYSLSVTASSALSDYFRAPVLVEDLKDGRLRLFSDFRANEVQVQVRLLRRAEAGAVDRLLYDGSATMTAMEYAYEAEVSRSVAQRLQPLSSSSPALSPRP